MTPVPCSRCFLNPEKVWKDTWSEWLNSNTVCEQVNASIETGFKPIHSSTVSRGSIPSSRNVCVPTQSMSTGNIPRRPPTAVSMSPSESLLKRVRDRLGTPQDFKSREVYRVLKRLPGEKLELSDSNIPKGKLELAQIARVITKREQS